MFPANDPVSKSKCLYTQNPQSKLSKGRDQLKSTFENQPFTHTLDLILPEELYHIVRTKLASEDATLQYYRGQFSLSEVVSGEFFDHYIKKGNILLLSEGRPLVDNLFSLRDGILRLELDRPTYERCGLVGKPIPDGGRKHAKSRYEILLNLREPSMVHGKKRFERLTWACKNVLNNSLTWLFYDLRETDPDKAPINQFHPQRKVIQPVTVTRPNLKMPSLTPASGKADASYAEGLYEWLALVALDSPRLARDDDIDPYLSRYAITELDPDGNTHENEVSGNIVKLRWQGFIPASFISRIFKLVGDSRESRWVALNACSFGGKGYTVLGLPNGDSYVWSCL